MDADPRLERAERRLEQARADARELAAGNDRLSAALRDARASLSTLRDQVAELASPPHQLGVITGVLADGLVEVAVGGRIVRTTTSAPEGEVVLPVVGRQVWLNDALVVIGSADRPVTGELATVDQVLADGRLLVSGSEGVQLSVTPTAALAAEGSRPGDRLIIDRRSRLGLEGVVSDDVAALTLDEVPGVTWHDIGGLDREIDQIRDAVELPFRRPDLFASYDLSPPRGILLYGPPGCGKTMIARAVANATGSAFLNVKGPELLNKYVGETERLIRVVFTRARELAGAGRPVIVFFDEMDALFRTRGSGVSSDMESTVVPQLLTEIDGVEVLSNVTVIGATNREDLIDPAILRPGRLDVKIRLDRPGPEQARTILGLHLGTDLPWDGAPERGDGDPGTTRAGLIEETVTDLYAREARNEFVEVTYASGDREVLFAGDFASGALLANIARRAKLLAVKDDLTGGSTGLSREHLLTAVRDEIRENEDLPGTTNADDWARVSGRRGEQVVFVRTLGRGGRSGVRALDT